MIYAKVIDGAIVARETKSAPVSKLSSDGGPVWRPIEDGGQPDYDVATQTLVKSEVIEQTRVLITRTPTEKTLDAAKAARIGDINEEAGARIIAIMPEYKQRNALALGLEMATTYGANPAYWPSAEQAIYAATSANWATIKSIRDASNIAVEAVTAAASNADVRAVTVAWPNA